MYLWYILDHYMCTWILHLLEWYRLLGFLSTRRVLSSILMELSHNERKNKWSHQLPLNSLSYRLIFRCWQHRIPLRLTQKLPSCRPYPWQVLDRHQAESHRLGCCRLCSSRQNLCHIGILHITLSYQMGLLRKYWCWRQRNMLDSLQIQRRNTIGWQCAHLKN